MHVGRWASKSLFAAILGTYQEVLLLLLIDALFCLEFIVCIVLLIRENVAELLIHQAREVITFTAQLGVPEPVSCMCCEKENTLMSCDCISRCPDFLSIIYHCGNFCMSTIH